MPGLGGRKPIDTNKFADIMAIESGRALKNIPLDKLNANKLNNYNQEHVDRLYYSILENGLYDPLTVYQSNIARNEYTVLSGHSRLAAIKKLTDEEYKRWFVHGVPCNVIEEPETEIDEKIVIHEANLTGRELSQAERVNLVAELKSLYEEKGYTDITKKLSEQLSVSERTIERTVAVSTLIPELQNDFKNNNLTLKDGAGLAALPKDAQLQVHKLIETASKKGEKVKTEDITKIKALESEKEKLQKEINDTKSELAKKTREIEVLKDRIANNPSSTNITRDKKNVLKKLEEEKELQQRIEKLQSESKLSETEAMVRLATRDWYTKTSSKLKTVSSSMAIHVDRLTNDEKTHLQKLIKDMQKLLDHEI